MSSRGGNLPDAWREGVPMRHVFSALVFASIVSSAYCQWAAGPGSSLVLSSPTPSDQAKIRTLSDGGCYVSWYGPSGYSVYVQRLDVFGIKQWASDGLLAISRNVSSTVDYDTDVDSCGNLLVIVNSASGASPIAQKISPSGQLMWGAGVTVHTGGTGYGNPKIKALSNGNIMTGWGVTNAFGLQELDSLGALVGNSVTVTETGHYLAPCDMVAGLNGSITLLYIRAFTNASSSKYLYAQNFKLDGANNLVPQWTGTGPAQTNGGNPVVIYQPAPAQTYYYPDATTGTYHATQGGSIQNAYFPPLVSDGAGGAVVGWYENAGPRRAYVQHILSDGTLKFSTLNTDGGTNGAVPVAFTQSTQTELGCNVAYWPLSGTIYASCPAAGSNGAGPQSMIVQQISSAGSRLFPNQGIYVTPTATGGVSFATPCANSGGMSTFCINIGASTYTIVGAGVDNSGFFVTNLGGPFGGVGSFYPIDSVASSKGRLTAKQSAEDFSIAAWTSSSQIWCNRINNDGTFGVTGVTVSGNVNLQQFDGEPGNEFVTIVLSQSGSVIESHQAILNSNGDFSTECHVNGTFDIFVKGRHWLQRAAYGQVIHSVNGLSSLSFSLVNGDCVADNEVNLVDIGAISTAFGSVEGDSNWDRNADLDGDGEVNIVDYGVGATHFGESGDE